MVLTGPNEPLKIVSKFLGKAYAPSIQSSDRSWKIIKEFEDIPLSDLDDKQAWTEQTSHSGLLKIV